MELVLISYPEFFNGEVKIVKKIFEAFSVTFHLRKPKADIDEIREFLKQIPEKLHKFIMVSNYPSLINEFQLKGVHFSTARRPVLLNKNDNLIYSTSCHSIEEIRNLNDVYNYVYISPVFKSISKIGYNKTLNIKEVENYLKEKRKMQIVALGGIDANKINELACLSFDGAAVLGAVWTDSPELNRSQIIDNFKRIHKCLN